MGLDEDIVKDPCREGNVLYFDSINAIILVVMLYNGVVRCNHWKKLEKV